MRFLIAPDKFKGSLGAAAVGARIAAGLRAVLPEAEIQVQPVADGGEGSAEVILRAQKGAWEECATHDALGREMTARYGWIGQSATAVLEMSEAAGLTQLAPNDRDPLAASTFGVGEMLRAAAARGGRQILVGLGGSATNDGGSGMARALGYRFLDAGGREIGTVAGLQALARIEPPNEFRLPAVTALSDVANPLLGPRGATRTFALQKGARAEEMEILERALTRLADIVEEKGRNLRGGPGTGAAGGLGFGLVAFAGAELRPGFDVIAEAVDLRRAIAQADHVITGEGSLDRQTLEGKAPAGVARIARELRKPVYAIVGRASPDEEVRVLFNGVFPLDDESAGFARTPALLETRARELAVSLSA